MEAAEEADRHSPNRPSAQVMDRVTVYTAFNPATAQIVCSRLQTAGIHASVEGEAAALSMEGYSLSTCTRMPPVERSKCWQMAGG